jgi:phosphate starvation-inducible protein PhoH
MAKKRSNNNNKQRTSVDKNNFILRTITPLTANQKVFFDTFEDYSHHMLLGYPGTGKTAIALFKALEMLENGEADRLTVFRSMVATLDAGHLPGTLEQKAAVFEAPYRSIVNSFYGRADAYDILRKKNVITFPTTSYERGNTYNDVVAIVDEIQNCTAHELDTIVTRFGSNSKLILCGDLNQQDITKYRDKNVYKVLDILESLPQCNTVHFDIDDIVRHDFIKKYIINKYKLFPDGF